MKSFRLLAVLFFLFSGCSQNLLSELGGKNSDDALIFDAQAAVNAQNYQDAIDIITLRLTASGQQRVSAREILSSAYAGKCGLNFLDYVTGLSEATSGSAFNLAAAPFVGVPVDPASCLLSLQTLDLIGTNASRTVDQNSFAAIVGMSLMGSATRGSTDANPTDGDGAEDAAGISCTLTDAQVDQIILGYAYMATNFSSLSTAQIGSSSQTAISDSITICSGLAGGSCTNTDPALITVQMRDAMKDLLNTSQYGVGVYDGSNPLLIPAACP